MATNPLTKVVTVEEMIAIEQAADATGHSYRAMMEHAGRALADHLLQTLAEHGLEPKILILVGPGNNGGDGLVAARLLRQALHDTAIAVYLLKSRNDEMLTLAEQAGVQVIWAEKDARKKYAHLRAWVADATIIVDALFGTGFRLPIKGAATALLQQIHQALDAQAVAHLSLTDPTHPFQKTERPLIVAVDCPSGLDCNTGELDPLTLKADSTVTFAAAKVGQFRFPGAAAVGHLRIGAIGLPENFEALAAIPLTLATATMVSHSLPQRPLNAHKGTFGKTMILAGSVNYTGAAYLAGAAAYRVGTGLVTIAAPQPIVPVLAGLLPEATWLLMPHEQGVLNEQAVEVLRDEIDGYTALLVGPGLGQDEATLRFVEALFNPEPASFSGKHRIGFRSSGSTETQTEAENLKRHLPPLVIDADGLNLLAKIEEWWRWLPPDTILTPHPTEFARLAGLEPLPDGTTPAQQVQADRVSIALRYAEKWNCVVVLKGAFTVVAQTKGYATIIPFATSALAKAGTGDVLAGAIAGLRAQGLAPAEAAIAGAWLHGYAGERAALKTGTPTSVVAGDLLATLPEAIYAAQNALA